MARVIPSKRPMVLAIGGNSLLQAHQVGTIDEQRENASETCAAIAAIIAEGHRLILAHGNGPQVGNVLLRVELAAEHVYTLPLDICDSDTQGGIGYMLQQILGDKLEALGKPRNVATVITQVLVDPDDEAFQNPRKPVGAFMTKEKAEAKAEKEGWSIKEVDSRGWRRVVASPKPVDIVELEAVRALYDAGLIPITVGGGGVPVYRDKSNLMLGVEAVIDKDLASSLLATKLNAEYFVITTSVSSVLLDYEKPTERPIARMTVAEAKAHHADGQFAPGSMGPKIMAACQFIENGGSIAIITDPENLHAALDGEAGTWITP